MELCDIDNRRLLECSECLCGRERSLVDSVSERCSPAPNSEPSVAREAGGSRAETEQRPEETHCSVQNSRRVKWTRAATVYHLFVFDCLDLDELHLMFSRRHTDTTIFI